MNLLQKSRVFQEKYGKEIKIGECQWKYYRLGEGEEVIFFLPGGLRKAAVSCEVLEELAKEFVIITIDYPPVKTIDEILDGIEAIIDYEGYQKVNMLGQSYGGVIAQAVAWFRPEQVKNLIISNSGPAIFNLSHKIELRIILPVIKILTEKKAKDLFASMIEKVFTSKDDKIREMKETSDRIIHKELAKKDIYSHFSVALSFSKKVSRKMKFSKNIRVYDLQSDDDVMHREKDTLKYKKLYKGIKIINLGNIWHDGMVTDQRKYCKKIKEITVGNM